MFGFFRNTKIKRLQIVENVFDTVSSTENQLTNTNKV